MKKHSLNRISLVFGVLFFILGACESKPQPEKSAKGWPTPLESLARELHVAAPGPACQGPCGCLDQLALAALNRGKSDDLLDALPKLNEDCRKTAAFSGVRAEALARQKRWPESEAAAEQATRSDAPQPFGHYALALGALERMSMKEAEAATARAEKDDRGVEVHRAYGQIALARGKFAECAQHFAELSDALPQDVEASFNRAVCEANSKHYKNAREAFLRTLRLNPKHARSRYMLVSLTAEVGAWAEAEHHLHEYAKLAPDDPQLPALREALKTRGTSLPDPSQALPGNGSGSAFIPGATQGVVHPSASSAAPKSAKIPQVQTP